MLVHDLIATKRTDDKTALLFRDRELCYQALWTEISSFASGLVRHGLEPGDRVAVYLPKQFETVTAIFGAAAAGGVFVPVNPVLKPAQVAYILNHCSVRVLVTSAERAEGLSTVLSECPDLRQIVVTAETLPAVAPGFGGSYVVWRDFMEDGPELAPHRRIDQDVAAILYTSGSTGKPKGVTLSHRNIVAGALSVSQYLENDSFDRLLAVLPFSFDYGLSQLTTAFAVGASAALMDYLLPRDVIRAVVKRRITGLAAVPPLWNQLAQLEWPPDAADSLRYITNTGGAMPVATTESLRLALPHTKIFLMYGLTEAFRSTYLPPEEVARRPDSIGKAIPDAEILVVRKDGSECAPNEPGELVHRGSHVSLGYWNDPESTAQRFKPSPGQPPELPNPELAVWSGDEVRRDEDGFIYFVSRKDEMIKTSGYRVSPTEVEEVVHGSGMVLEAVALGLPHPLLGQAILLLAQPSSANEDHEELLNLCREELPNYMIPHEVLWVESVPRNANGKVDRKALSDEYREHFQEALA